jgi:hypothetical protein
MKGAYIMSWSWSHTDEAYNNACANMANLPRKERNIIAAEWIAAIPHPKHGIHFHAEFNEKKYDKALKRVSLWDGSQINVYIWNKMRAYATCTNGGFEAYCCPFGCGPHLVSFGDKSPQETA